MQSVNLIVHIVSGLVVVGMMWAILRQQKTLQFQRKLWDSLSSKQKKVYLDWPTPFFRSLRDVWGIRVAGVFETDQPLKIALDTWSLCHAKLGIASIEGRPDRLLSVRVARLEDSSSWKERLEQALSHRFRIELQLNSEHSS